MSTCCVANGLGSGARSSGSADGPCSVPAGGDRAARAPTPAAVSRERAAEVGHSHKLSSTPHEQPSKRCSTELVVSHHPVPEKYGLQWTRTKLLNQQFRSYSARTPSRRTLPKQTLQTVVELEMDSAEERTHAAPSSCMQLAQPGHSDSPDTEAGYTPDQAGLGSGKKVHELNGAGRSWK